MYPKAIPAQLPTTGTDSVVCHLLDAINMECIEATTNGPADIHKRFALLSTTGDAKHGQAPKKRRITKPALLRQAEITNHDAFWARINSGGYSHHITPAASTDSIANDKQSMIDAE